MYYQRNLFDYLPVSASRFTKKIAFSDEKNELSYKQMLDRSYRAGAFLCRKFGAVSKPVAVAVGRTADTIAAFTSILAAGMFYVPIDTDMPCQRMRNILKKVEPVCFMMPKSLEKKLEGVSDICGFVTYEEAFYWDMPAGGVEADREGAETGGRAAGSEDAESCGSTAISEDAEAGGSAAVGEGAEAGGSAANSDDDKNVEACRRVCDEAREKVLDTDPAYMIFTSGSTGFPKGIVISHRSVIDFTEWMSETFEFCEDDIFGNQAPFYFDLSVKDIYQTLKNGASCHIIPKKMFMFPKLLLELAEKKHITAFVWATSAFHLVANSGALSKVQPSSLKQVILGGEALGAKQLNVWKRALADVRYVNLYGPTEVTVDCAYYVIDRDFEDHEMIPVGRACKNMQIMLLDDDLKPVPSGMPGEICVRGAGVALGYYGDTEKTSAAFIQNPLNDRYRDIVYRTGDIGVMKDDGLIYFKSRGDGQIKHMGYRIETGEIETSLNSLPEIENAICIFDDAKDKIVAFYSGNCDKQEIIKKLSDLVPKYMYPNIFIKLEELPVNANGKTDRARLKKEYSEGRFDD